MSDGYFIVPAYRAGRPRAAYVRMRLELMGVVLDGIELDGADVSDTRGYAVHIRVPAMPATFRVPGEG